MNKNVGTTDAIIRYALSIIFVILGFLYTPWFFIIALILIVTSLLGWCAIYALFRINTCKETGLTNTSIPPVNTTTNIDSKVGVQSVSSNISTSSMNVAATNVASQNTSETTTKNISFDTSANNFVEKTLTENNLTVGTHTEEGTVQTSAISVKKKSVSKKKKPAKKPTNLKKKYSPKKKKKK